MVLKQIEHIPLEHVCEYVFLICLLANVFL